jgi:hypothetical protein
MDNPQPATRPRRRTGKVASLPKAVRLRLNHMLEDGLTYPQIIESLGPDGHGLTEDNISQWWKGGHQDWLLERVWFDDVQSCRDGARDLLEKDEATTLPEAGLQIGAMRIYQLLRHLEPAPFAANLQEKPEGFMKVFAALPRVAKEALRYQKYRDACEQARAALQPLLDPKRKLTDEERVDLVHRVDELLGMRKRGDRKAEDPGRASQGQDQELHDNGTRDESRSDLRPLTSDLRPLTSDLRPLTSDL